MSIGSPAAQGPSTCPLLLAGDVVWQPGSDSPVTIPSPPIPRGRGPAAEYKRLSPTCTNTGVGTTTSFVQPAGDLGPAPPRRRGGLCQRNPSYPHPHLALHRKRSHSYGLGETYIHLLCTAVPQLSRPTYLMMTEITPATIDWVLAVQGTNCFPYVILLNFHLISNLSAQHGARTHNPKVKSSTI